MLHDLFQRPQGSPTHSGCHCQTPGTGKKGHFSQALSPIKVASLANGSCKPFPNAKLATGIGLLTKEKYYW